MSATSGRERRSEGVLVLIRYRQWSPDEGRADDYANGLSQWSPRHQQDRISQLSGTLPKSLVKTDAAIPTLLPFIVKYGANYGLMMVVFGTRSSLTERPILCGIFFFGFLYVTELFFTSKANNQWSPAKSMEAANGSITERLIALTLPHTPSPPLLRPACPRKRGYG